VWDGVFLSGTLSIFNTGRDLRKTSFNLQHNFTQHSLRPSDTKPFYDELENLMIKAEKEDNRKRAFKTLSLRSCSLLTSIIYKLLSRAYQIKHFMIINYSVKMLLWMLEGHNRIFSVKIVAFNEICTLNYGSFFLV